jgi:hypothetical protein
MHPKIPQLVEALTGNFGEHHAFLCRLHLERIDQLTTAILELSARIEEEMPPFTRQLERRQTIPGVGQATAEVVIAETGGGHDPLPHRGASGLLGRGLPGHYESAGRHKSGKTHTATGGSVPRWAPPRWPPPAPKTAPTSAPATTASHRGWAKKAIVAVEHSILTAVWRMLADDVDYHDLGGDYFTHRDPHSAMRRIIRQANALGFAVRFDPIPSA